MNVSETREGEIVVLAVVGRLDQAAAGAFGEQLAGQFGAPGRRLLLEMAQLDYISSAGFRVLLVAAKRARESHGQLALTGISGHVRELFEVGGFLKLFKIFGSRAEALGALG